MKKQNGFLWPKAFFGKNTQKVTVDVSYDEDALNTLIQNLKPVTVEQTQLYLLLQSLTARSLS